MLGLLCTALVGVLHVHHAPSHDSQASFDELIEAAHTASLDFVVLTDHADALQRGDLPASEHAGFHVDDSGHRVLVLVGVEVGTDAGHLLGYDLPRMPSPEDRSGRAVIEAIHRLGGFAVVPHPFSYGGWHDWDAPFDGIEVHNNAAAFRQLGLAMPLRIVQLAFSPDAALRAMLARPVRELERWEELLQQRRVVAFSGADAHRNVSILGWQLDPYARMFAVVQTLCPDVPLEPRAVWRALRHGDCYIRYQIHAGRGAAVPKVFASGRFELWVDQGRNVLEIHQPPVAPAEAAILQAP